MVLPSDIDITNGNDINIINNVLDDTIGTYYVSSNDDMIKCPPGYVFEGSHMIFNGKDRSIIRYDRDSNKWINLNNQRVDWSADSITCKRKYCESLGIVNSDKEYEVVIDKEYEVVIDDVNDSENDSEKVVTCNGGYVFDTTDTRMGEVRCGIIPSMDGTDLEKENEVTWFVNNEYNDRQCAGESNENACNLKKISISISDNVNQIHDNNGKEFNCTWIPPIDDNDSGFIRSQGQCKFLHRADLNNTNPICRAMYCNSKEIPNSNRTTTGSGPLPGPETGSIHGDCVNFDGQIISNITNSSDCSCFKHKSCDTCTDNENCQWCGSDGGEGGFCYSTKTHLSICNDSIRHNRGGTCIHPKTHRSKYDEPDGGWTKDSCENSICVKKTHWDNLDENNYMTDKNDSNLYNNDMIGPDDCRYDNKFWDESALVHAPDKCIVKNNFDDIDIFSSIPYYPLTISDGIVRLNVSDEICVPNGVGDSGAINPVNIERCNELSKNQCNSDSGCNYIDNILKDSNFNWSDQKSIKFNNSGECPIESIAGDNNGIFNIQYFNNGYINLLNSSLSDSINDNYYESCSIIDPLKEKNIVSSTLCSSIGGPADIETHYCEPPNIRYCDIGSRLCPEGSTVNLEQGIVAGCEYYEELTGDIPDGYMCYGDVEYNCSELNTDIYNCEKTLSGTSNTNQSQCTNTQYTIVDNTNSLIVPNTNSDIENITNSIKPYIKCDTSVGGVNDISSEDRCNLIGNNYAHWGNFCSDSLDNKYPVKHICELHPNTTWGKYIDINPSAAGNFGWGCYNNEDGSKYTNEEICGLVSTNLESKIETNDTSKPNNSIILKGIRFSGDTNIINIPDDSTIESSDRSITGDIISSTTIDKTDNVTINNNEINVSITSGEFISSPYTIKDNQGTVLITIEPPLQISKVLSNDVTDDICIIDGTPNGDTFNDYQFMCENSSNHTIGFRFLENSSNIQERGICKNKRTREPVIINGESPSDPVSCTSSNMYYTTEYIYNSNNSCPIDNISKPDIPTDWTGGEISYDDGLHVSECSPSIMSSCNVSCNPGYGGGGEFVCLYNKEGGDICEKISNKSDDIFNTLTGKGELCNSYPACDYDEDTNTCNHSTDIENDGHLEWIGPDCYRLDNTAFSHGIAPLPSLDVVFPPFKRFLIFIIIYLFFAIIIIYITVKFGFNKFGKLLDYLVNTFFGIFNKIINIFTNSGDILDFALSSNIKTEGKFVALFISIVLFIGAYFIFDYFKNNIKNFMNSIDRYKRNIDRILSRLISGTTLTAGGIISSESQEVGELVGGEEGGTIEETGGIISDTIIDSVANREDLNTIMFIIKAVGYSIVFLIILLVISNLNII